MFRGRRRGDWRSRPSADDGNIGVVEVLSTANRVSSDIGSKEEQTANHYSQYRDTGLF